MTVTVRRWDDPSSWNSFASTVPAVHFQQSWEWGELAPQLGTSVVRLAAIENGELVGAIQMFANPLSRLGRNHFYVPRGPAIRAPQVDILKSLLGAAREIARERNVVGIRVEPNAPATDGQWLAALRDAGLRPTLPASQPRSSWLLDISPGLDELLAGMKQKTRYNIRLAVKKGVEVSTGSIEDLDDFYSLYSATASRDDFAIHPKELYRRTFELFRDPDSFSLLLARYEGKSIAAVTIIRFGKTCWYLHGASGNQHRNLMAPYLLQWEAIQRAKAWGCRLYDFRGVPDVLREDQDMYGVYRFKEGFGGFHYTTLETQYAAYSSAQYSLWRLAYRGRFALEAWRRRRRGLPARQFA